LYVITIEHFRLLHITRRLADKVAMESTIVTAPDSRSCLR
jgi:hypothetical protein